VLTLVRRLVDKTQTFWQKRTGIGFLLGWCSSWGNCWVSLLVRSSTPLSDHLKEFGTLKAMGASDWVIYGVIIEQALWMAILGYLPAWFFALAWELGRYATQGIIILITPATAIGFWNYGFDVGSASLRFKRLPVSTQRSYSRLEKCREADDSLALPASIKLQVIRFVIHWRLNRSCRADQIHLLHSRLSF